MNEDCGIVLLFSKTIRMPKKLQNKAFLFGFSTLYFKVVKHFGLLQLECGLLPSSGHI